MSAAGRALDASYDLAKQALTTDGHTGHTEDEIEDMVDAIERATAGWFRRHYNDDCPECQERRVI